MGCCIGAIAFAGAPRLALFVLWLLTDRIAIAFESLWPALAGFILLPYTTVLYILAYAPQSGVSGIGWVVVMLGLLLDLSSYSSGAYSKRSTRQRA